MIAIAHSILPIVLLCQSADTSRTRIEDADLSFIDAALYQFAADRKQLVFQRVHAAESLSPQGCSKLRIELHSQLPGRWDNETCHVMQILASIGNWETIEKLNAIDQMPVVRTGRFNSVLMGAILRIQARVHKDGMR